MNIASHFDHALLSDISRFYGTLYTHAIPWALHNKSWCKRNLSNSAYKQSLGNRLDVAIRKGQENQSVGIPVGPDTSRIISEIIAVSIDSAIQDRLQLSKGQAFRQIDDWLIGFDSVGDAEKAIAALSAVCQEFEIELNNEKTWNTTCGLSGKVTWPEEIRQFIFEERSSKQKSSLDHYLLRHSNMQRDSRIKMCLIFPLSEPDLLSVHEDNWPIYEMYLLQAGRSYPIVIPSIVQIFASYNRDLYPIEKDRIQKFTEDVIEKNAPLAHHAEVAWALFLAKVLGLKLSRSTAASVSEMNSSVCALLALDLESRGQISGRLNKRILEGIYVGNGSEIEYVLLAYEADVKGWLSGPVGDMLMQTCTLGNSRQKTSRSMMSKGT